MTQILFPNGPAVQVAPDVAHILVGMGAAQLDPVFSGLDNVQPPLPVDGPVCSPTCSVRSFSAIAAAGTAIGTLTDPFAGLGLGTTAFAVPAGSSVPPQLAVNGRSVTVGTTAAAAGTVYPLTIQATSGDGLRSVTAPIRFTATP